MYAVIEKIQQIFSERGTNQYGTEAVTQLEHALQSGVLAEASSAQQTSRVRRWIVRIPRFQPVSVQLQGVRLADGHVARDGGVDNLANHAFVRESDHKSVLWRVILVLVLRD